MNIMRGVQRPVRDTVTNYPDRIFSQILNVYKKQDSWPSAYMRRQVVKLCNNRIGNFRHASEKKYLCKSRGYSECESLYDNLVLSDLSAVSLRLGQHWHVFPISRTIDGYFLMRFGRDPLRKDKPLCSTTCRAILWHRCPSVVLRHAFIYAIWAGPVTLGRSAISNSKKNLKDGVS